MTSLIACISDDRTRRHARIGDVDGSLDVLDASAHFADEALRILDLTLGAGVRAESARAGAQDVWFEEPQPGDPRLIDTVAAAFRACGYAVVLLDPKRSEAWRMLRELPLELDIRDTLSPGLAAMPDADVDDLLSLMREAKRELEESAATGEAERAAIRAEALEEIQTPPEDGGGAA